MANPRKPKGLEGDSTGLEPIDNRRLANLRSLIPFRTPARITIDPVRPLSLAQSQTLIELFNSKASIDDTSFVFHANIPYVVAIPRGSEHLTEVKLNHPVVMQKRQDQGFNIYVVNGSIQETEYVRKYGILGQLSIDQQQITFTRSRVNTIITDFFAFDPLRFSPAQGKTITHLLNIINRQREKFFPAGVNQTAFVSDNNTVIQFIYFDLKYPLFIREREHHRDELRYEFLINILGRGTFGTTFATATLAIHGNEELFVKRQDRIAKVGNENLWLAYEEHLKAKRMFGRGSKTPMEIFTKDGWRTVRIERLLQKIDLITYFEETKKQTAKPLDTDQILWILRNLTVEVKEIHAMGFRHRDIKPDNIIINPDAVPPHAHIIDFGLALWHKVKDIISAGTPLYASPEALFQNHTTRDSDIFSLGAVFGLLLGGEEHPASSMSKKSGMQKVGEFVLDYKFNQLFSISHNLSPEHQETLRSLIAGMLTVTPNFRPKPIKILEILESIILQRDIASLPTAEQDKYKQSYASAVTLRKELAKNISTETLDDYDDENDQSIFKRLCIKLLNENLTADTQVSTFIKFADVKLFANCSTVADIKDACSKVFIEHQVVYQQLDALKQSIESLKALLKKHFLYDKPMQHKLFKIREVIGICLDRKAEMPLTLDYLAEFNHKCLRDIQTAQSRLQQLEYETNAKVQIQPRSLIGNPAPLFAQSGQTSAAGTSAKSMFKI